MKTDEGSFFVDTNILVYASVRDDARHEACKRLLRNSTRTLNISAQILTEFYSIVTNPRRVSLPFEPSEAIAFIQALLSVGHVAVLPISSDVPHRLLALLRTTDARGPEVFDLQIAATMLASGLTKLFTYNLRDFRAIAGIEAIEPD
jgi:predicted nucleic acid-binding protein